MKLTPHEQAMLRGDIGSEIQRAIEQQIQVGEFWGADRFVEVTIPLYDRAALPAGAVVTGPAVIEDEWSTIVVYPGQRAAADARGHLILDLEPIS